jgi:hypothetical protein
MSKYRLVMPPMSPEATEQFIRDWAAADHGDRRITVCDDAAPQTVTPEDVLHALDTAHENPSMEVNADTVEQELHDFLFPPESDAAPQTDQGRADMIVPRTKSVFLHQINAMTDWPEDLVFIDR